MNISVHNLWQERERESDCGFFHATRIIYSMASVCDAHTHREHRGWSMSDQKHGYTTATRRNISPAGLLLRGAGSAAHSALGLVALKRCTLVYNGPFLLSCLLLSTREKWKLSPVYRVSLMLQLLFYSLWVLYIFLFFSLDTKLFYPPTFENTNVKCIISFYLSFIK